MLKTEICKQKAESRKLKNEIVEGASKTLRFKFSFSGVPEQSRIGIFPQAPSESFPRHPTWAGGRAIPNPCMRHHGAERSRRGGFSLSYPGQSILRRGPTSLLGQRPT